MIHEFEEVQVPKSKIVVWRCKHCAIKVASLSAWKGKTCVERPSSKKMNKLHADGHTFAENQRLYYKNPPHGKNEKPVKRAMESENLFQE